MPSLFTRPSAPAVSAPAVPSGIPSVDSVGNTLWQFGWLSILLLLFLPAVREPIVNLWTAVFRFMAIPFLFLRQAYDNWVGPK